MMNNRTEITNILLKLEESVDRDLLKERKQLYESELLHAAIETWENIHHISHAWHVSQGELLRMAAVGLFGAGIARYTDLGSIWKKIVNFSTDKAKKLLGAAKVINQSKTSDEAEEQLQNMGLQLVPINESMKKRLKEGREPHADTIGSMRMLAQVLQSNISKADAGEFNLDEIKDAMKELNSQLSVEKGFQTVHNNYVKEIGKLEKDKAKAQEKEQGKKMISAEERATRQKELNKNFKPVEEGPKDEVKTKKQVAPKPVNQAVNPGKQPVQAPKQVAPTQTNKIPVGKK